MLDGTMTFEEKLRVYAELLVVHGLNVQKGQILNIGAEPIHRDFCCLIAEAAYERGAKYVEVVLGESRIGKLRLEKSALEDLEYVPSHIPVKYDELLDSGAANLRIIGAEDPDIYKGIDTKRVNTVRLSQHKAIRRFYEEAIGKSRVHWTVAAAATPAWGKKIFPELTPEEAEMRLWDEILRICRADTSDCLSLWQTHNEALHSRALSLTNMKIETLHFTGPGTDLKVGLSEKAKFKGGTDIGPHGVPFEPNIPTEEVFTTPDYRKTSGKVTTTRPFLINGVLVENLMLEFTEGVISHFSATEGEETFREYISSDEGAKRLGEVALVGIDSPVFTSGLIYQEILFDENAACHIAIGSAYKFCLEGGESLSDEDCQAIGCNVSNVHTDMMISSEQVDVVAKTREGQEVVLIKGGQWQL